MRSECAIQLCLRSRMPDRKQGISRHPTVAGHLDWLVKSNDVKTLHKHPISHSRSRPEAHMCDLSVTRTESRFPGNEPLRPPRYLAPFYRQSSPHCGFYLSNKVFLLAFLGSSTPRPKSADGPAWQKLEGITGNGLGWPGCEGDGEGGACSSSAKYSTLGMWLK